MARPETIEAIARAQGIPPAYAVACSTPPGGQESGRGAERLPVVAAGGGRLGVDIKDVTGRYTSSLLTLQRLRDGTWWESLLSALSQAPDSADARTGGGGGESSTAVPPRNGAPGAPTPGSHPTNVGRSDSSSDATISGPRPPPQPMVHPADREDQELRLKVSSQMQVLPTSIEGFKTHPLYILKRHLTKYQALRPGSSLLGSHKVRIH